MDAMNYSQVRAHLAETMEKVCDDHEPVIITRQGRRAVVLISLEDYKSMDETAYLLSSPENARRLRESVAEFEAGRYTVRDLIDVESGG